MSFSENAYRLPRELAKDAYKLARTSKHSPVNNKELKAWGKLIFGEAKAMTRTAVSETAHGLDRILK